MALSGWGVFLIIFFILLAGAGGGYVFYTRYRAKKLGLPPPPLNPFAKRSGGDNSTYRGPTAAPGDIVSWVKDKISQLRSGRTAGGAYESTSYDGARTGTGRRGFGPMDPDEVWDARVGYNEEAELGLSDPSHGPYGGGGYGDVGLDEGRGRSRSRSRDTRTNPFGEHAEESSMRSVSPRPDAPPQAHAPGHSRGPSNVSIDDSPSERRSMFTEDV